MLNKNTFICGIFLALTIFSTTNAYQNLTPSGYPTQIANYKVNDMHVGKKYNYYQTDQRIFMMDKNNTLVNLYEISIPDIIFAQQVCSKFAFHESGLYSASACRDLSDNVTYIVMVSHLSSRPFYFFSLKTDMKPYISEMKFTGDLLAVRAQEGAQGLSVKNHMYRINLGSSMASVQPVEYLGSHNIQVNQLLSKAGLSVTNENTTFREWFVLFLAILGCLAVLARCTSKKEGNQVEARAPQPERTESANTDSYRLLDEGNKNCSLSSANEARV